ncbi:MAG: division/cell wall cluster transcriptional repressor MraZ [Actinomycetota bacterium]
MFLGEFQHSLDAKGRIILPSRFRGRLESGLVLTRGLDGCLWVMSQGDWESFSLRLTALSVADPRGRDTARFFFSGASEDRPDKQGRISVPEPLRRHASLERDVVVIGTGPRIEVWNPERWEVRRASVEENLEDRIADLQL